ncbi:MAG: DUF5046 domain-containing protein [Oscillospiraceae bacterium]|nr:DUF5046 domain-containing protein [Oscillospiraceae bacterium]
MIKLRTQILCASVAIALIMLAGCGPPNEPPAPDRQDASLPEDSSRETEGANQNGGRIYSIPMGDDQWFTTEYWVIDGDGNEVAVSEDDPSGYTEMDLTDLATGEVRYRFRVREEVVRDEQGYLRTNALWSLYDLDGSMLIDWEEKRYGDAFGEYIIRQDRLDGIVSAEDVPQDYHTALYHVPTGAERYEGAFGANRLDDGAFLLSDHWGTPLGVVDSAGEAVSGFPTPKPYFGAYTWNGYLIAESVHSNERNDDNPGISYILDQSFRELYIFDGISGFHEGLRGDYLMYENGGERGIFSPKDGILFSVNGASVGYYDGELAIVQTGSPYRPEDGPVSVALVTADHTELIGGLSRLAPAEVHIYGEKRPAERFLGLLDGKAVLVDRGGNILASSFELPEVSSINMMCDGLYTYSVELDGQYRVGLLGSALEVILPADRYTGIYLASEEWDCSAEIVLLQAGRYADESEHVTRFDILDDTGRVIVDNITAFYDAGPNRIAIKRGFDIGLIDWDGNWIIKRRIFTGLGND